MGEKERGNRILSLLSALYVAGALLLLGSVCENCYPDVGNRLRQVLVGLEDNPVREAFATLADGLEAGLPVVDTVFSSFEVLLGELT